MSSAGNPPGRKRARPSNASSNASRRPPADDASRPAKRSRPSAGGAPAALGSRSSAAALLRGPNPSVARNRIGGQQDAAASASRPSLHDVTPSQIQNKPPPRRRSAQTKTAAKRTAGPAQAGGRSGSTRRRPQQQESSPDEQPLSRSRRRADEAPEGEEEEIRDSESEGDIDDDDDDDGPPSPEKPYPHVAPFTRRVRQSTIETKWSPLGRGSLKALTSILQLAQRPVLQRLSSSSAARAAPTEAALRLITKRILDKIRGVAARDVAPLPFPPASLPTRTQRGRPRGGRAEQDGGRETELNFESVLDAKQTLERQLDPVLHAVDLLGAEARRMEDELERDYERLRLMEAEARTRARENRSLLKKAHVLAPEDGAAEGGARGEDGQGVKIRLVLTLAAWLQNIEDPEIKDMVATLGAHVDRLQANVEQTTGVGEQIQRTRAALQAVLAAKVGAQTYEHVVLGR
ncbi:hypothetical protein A9K55_001908 [Cordyceps militaris]|uniref:Kinetochore protein fta7 n=1 Tax=Cordyceps militaris TaxID=73501 RepID=A0A2H4SQL8_CORMI|nr:hypothetical protein A9K55_001908 [Cordyceps militaris]